MPAVEPLAEVGSISLAKFATILMFASSAVPWLVTRMVYLVDSPTEIGSGSSTTSIRMAAWPRQSVQASATSRIPSAWAATPLQCRPTVPLVNTTSNVCLPPLARLGIRHEATLPLTEAPVALTMRVAAGAVSVTTTSFSSVSPVLETTI